MWFSSDAFTGAEHIEGETKQSEVTAWVRRKERDEVMTDIILLFEPFSSEKYTSSKNRDCRFSDYWGVGMQQTHCGVTVVFCVCMYPPVF